MSLAAGARLILFPTEHFPGAAEVDPQHHGTELPLGQSDALAEPRRGSNSA
jgi:hypothetical protein